MNRYKLVIFDLIDTLADCKGLPEMTARLEDSFSKETIDAFIDHGNIDKIKSVDDAIARFRTIKDFSQKDEILLRQWVEWSETFLYEDTIETLQYLKSKGYKIAIISNSPPTSKDTLSDLKIKEYIDELIFSFAVGSRKPEPEIFMTCLLRAGVEPSEAVMIGDSLKNDIHGAISVGINAILIDRNSTLDYEPRVRSLSELRNLL